jgi:hypothetical protein
MQPFTPVATHFLDALRRRDFPALAACLDPRVQLRALQPGGAVVRMGSGAVIDRFRGWFGSWDSVEAVRVGAWSVGAKLAMRYRFEVCSAGATYEIEQQLYCDLVGERIAAIDLLSSGPAGTGDATQSAECSLLLGGE